MSATQRQWSDAFEDAVPDALAAGACALAWIQPDALGFDLLNTAGLLYFVELPLALLIGFAGVRRVRDGRLSRDEKLWIVLLPTLVLSGLSLFLLGVSGLIAVAWLGTLSIARLLRGSKDDSPDVPGLWLVFGKRGSSVRFELAVSREAAQQPGAVLVPAGHEQLMAGATIATWIWIPVAVALLPSFGTGGATAAYADSVGWNDTVIGSVIPAHLALAAGVILFAIRTLGHFERVSEPPPANIAEDDVLQEIIAKVEGKPPRKRGKR